MVADNPSNKSRSPGLCKPYGLEWMVKIETPLCLMTAQFVVLDLMASNIQLNRFFFLNYNPQTRAPLKGHKDLEGLKLKMYKGPSNNPPIGRK